MVYVKNNINVTVKLQYLRGNDEENVCILIKDTVFYIFDLWLVTSTEEKLTEPRS